MAYVGYSDLAGRTGPMNGRTASNVSHEDTFGSFGRGVDMAGLGCTLEEWDAVAATMPLELRPSIRGGWNGSFEVAFLRYRKGQPAPAAVQRDNTFAARSQEIRSALRNGALPVSDIAAITNRHVGNTYKTLQVLIAGGCIERQAAMVNGTKGARYALTGRPCRSGAPQNATRTPSHPSRGTV